MSVTESSQQEITYKELLKKIEEKEPKLSKIEIKMLKIREAMKHKKPRFMRMDEWRFWRIARKESWRKPRGLDNKIRKEVKGYPPKVKVGYGKPSLVKGLHPSGFKEVIVYRPEDLDKIDPQREAIRIASCVGLRKRIEIVKKALEKGIKILNLTEDVKKVLGL